MHWDPFEGQMPQLPPPPPGKSAKSGGAVRNLGAVIALLGGIVLIAEVIFFGDLIVQGFPVIGAAVCTIGFVVLFVFGGDPRAEIDARLSEIAQANGWSFKTVKQRVRRSSSSVSAVDIGGGVSKDPAMEAAYATIGPLILPQVGDLAPVNPQALIWGQIDGRDLWLGVEEMAALNLPGQDAKAAVQTALSGQGAIYRFVLGLRLAADLPATGVVDAIGPAPSWETACDLDAELTLKVAPTTPEAARQALRQRIDGALPKLRDLFERFEARIMVHGSALFVTLKDTAHQQSGDALPAHVRELVQECAVLAVALEETQT